MKTHMSGKFIAVTDIDYEIPMGEQVTDLSTAFICRAIKRKTIERVDEITRDIQDKYGITLVFMPEFVEGMSLDD